MPEAADTSRPGGEPPKAPIERRHLGGTERRRHGQEAENRPPVSRQELSKAPAELIEEPGPRVNWRVFVIASAVIVAFSLWAMLVPTHAAGTMQTMVA
ncbi:hypothetical protein [Streptomyces sp. NPDC086782]